MCRVMRRTMNQGGFAYLLTNTRHTVLYVGSTRDLCQRVDFHKRRLLDGFTKKYNVDKLVYFEAHSTIASAQARETQLKGMSRGKKSKLISAANPSWQDLYTRLAMGF